MGKLLLVGETSNSLGIFELWRNKFSADRHPGGDLLNLSIFSYPDEHSRPFSINRNGTIIERG
jgi:hypothetical protein